MITEEQAIETVQRELKRMESLYESMALKLMLDHTRIESFGWVFFYNSEEYLNTGNISAALAGNAPLIVNKWNGKLTSTGTAMPVEFYIEKYKENLP